MNNTISIDPGVTGAIAYITDNGATVWDMPLIKGQHDTQMIDTALISEVIADQWPYDIVIIERPQWRRHDGAKQVVSIWFNYGRLCACFEAWGEVAPKVWKKDMGLDSDKELSLEMARELFPNLASMLTRKKDHNRAEALLIGAWFRKINRVDEMPTLLA